MNQEPNPYAPPQVDPVATPLGIQDSGSLWRIVDGRLQFREMASLPNVSISGSQHGEPGTRFSLALESRALVGWVRGVALLLLGAVGFAGLLHSHSAKTIAFFAVVSLPGLLGKKARILVFRSKRKESAINGRSWLGALLVGMGSVLLIHLLRTYWVNLPAEDFLLLLAVVVGAVQLVFLLAGKWPPVRTLGDGWFELRKVPPEAIRQLEEIQLRMPPNTNEAPLRHR